MKILKFFSGKKSLIPVVLGLISCASAVNLPGAGTSPVFQTSAEQPHYASQILIIAQGEKNERPDQRQHEHAAGELPYVCPMHADVQSDKPGKCPKCGMKLQLREKTAAPAKETGHEHH